MKRTPLESSVEKTVTHEARKAGGDSFKIVPTTVGIPDRVVLLPGGRTIWVELKRDKKRDLDPAQRIWHRRVRERYDIHVVVLRGSGEVRSWARAGFPVPWTGEE